MARRSLMVHGGVFLLSALLALKAWTKQDVKSGKEAVAELWSGTPSKIERVEFETKKRKVTLESQEDAAGRYFVGTVEKTKVKKEERSDPHAPPPKAPDLTDAGAEKEVVRFISAKAGETLYERLAPMSALRVLGKIDESRLSEFGFDQDHGTVRVTLGGKLHQLTLGGETPGGADIYVRDPDTSNGYVVDGSISNELDAAETRLIAHEFSGYSEDELQRVRIVKGAATRELAPMKDTKGFWANPNTADQKDETASNWMSKLQRLRVINYVEKPEPEVKPEDLVVRLEYLGRGQKQLGFMELVKRPPTPGSDSHEYYARGDQSRWYATVLKSAAEQVEQDLGSVLSQ